jgi:hypothetical protein
MPYIYSTLTNDVDYATYKYDTPLANGHKQARLDRSIIIKGGTNVATPIKRRGGEPDTPIGVRTEVTREEMALLMENETFLEHMKKGFIKEDSRKVDPEKLAAKMDIKDPSRPRTPETDKASRIPVAQVA